MIIGTVFAKLNADPEDVDSNLTRLPDEPLVEKADTVCVEPASKTVPVRAPAELMVRLVNVFEP